jgi:hypothetical protein
MAMDYTVDNLVPPDWRLRLHLEKDLLIPIYQL